jgi:REP element-mobilizing transposase RayT
MPNHAHLLIERREDAVGRIMQSLLTGYSQYFNRKYKKIGHLFQSRYKGILCQTDQSNRKSINSGLTPPEAPDDEFVDF